jgi:hypothetical protein
MRARAAPTEREESVTSADFDRRLPTGKEWFSVRWLARHWGKSVQHVINLIESGEITESVDFRGKAATRADRQVHRAEVVAFLERRRLLSAQP